MDIHARWESCTACELGARRESLGNRVVFGEGQVRGLLFVGEGPGWMEEKEARPFIGPSGNLLRQVLAKLGDPPSYFTNTVICRSCTPVLDPETQQVVMKKRYGSKVPLPLFRDEPPTPLHMNACNERLMHEIYAVDPIVIVTLGGKAAEHLTGRPFSVTTQRGNETTITIPGNGVRPVLTEKKKQWYRGAKANILQAAPEQRPVEQTEVSYLLVPTLHPAYVLRKIADKGPSSAFTNFAADLKYAVGIYERYYTTTIGEIPILHGGDNAEDLVDTLRTEWEETEEEDAYEDT